MSSAEPDAKSTSCVQVQLQALAELLDLDLARRDLGLEILHQPVVGPAQLLDLGAACRELGLARLEVLGELGLGGAQLLHVAVEGVVRFAQRLHLVDRASRARCRRLSFEASSSSMRSSSCCFSCVERVALGFDFVIGTARDAAGERERAGREQRRASRGGASV